MRYLRLWWQFVVNSFVREAEYRANFVVGLFEGVLQLGLAVFAFQLMYSFTDEVAGWTKAQVLVLVGVYRVVDGLFSTFLAPNLLRISTYIRNGEMDFFLLRPVSSQFMVSLRVLSLNELSNVVIGLLLVAYAAPDAGVVWSPERVVAAVVFALCGIALIYTLWFVILTCSFWWVQVDASDSVLYNILTFAQYPVQFFSGLLRVVLTVAVPVAFATTFPTEALLGVVDWRLLVAAVLFAGVALVFTNRFWNFAVRHYSSASS